MRDLYQNRANRDAEFKRLGGTKAGYRKSSIQGQILHPMYVKDYVGTYETGFGNTDYRTFFSVLYRIEKDRTW